MGYLYKLETLDQDENLQEQWFYYKKDALPVAKKLPAAKLTQYYLGVQSRYIEELALKFLLGKAWWIGQPKEILNTLDTTNKTKQNVKPDVQW